MTLRMLAKLFHAEHQIITPTAEGWSVNPMECGFHLAGPAGETVLARLGDEVAEGVVFQKKHGLYYLGDLAILTPETHWMDAQARPARGSEKFFIERAGKRPIPAAVGQRVGHFGGVLTRSDAGLLMLNGKVVLETKKTRELSLIVFDKEDGEGHLAYFNVHESGQRKAPVGTRGRFVRDARGARFMELGGDDIWHDTARFYDPAGNYVEAALRPLNYAERSAALSEEWQALVREAESLGVDVADLEEHDAIAAEREALASAWKRHQFVIADGLAWVRSQTRSEEYSPR